MNFSTSADHAIQSTLDVVQQSIIDDKERLTSEELVEAYEIEQTVELIRRYDYKRIGLQFPDELLHHSVAVYFLLKDRFAHEQDADDEDGKTKTNRDLYILADTTYGSCCVDEVAAAHIEADVVVHYGHSCLSLTSRLPVIYVFGKHKFDVQRAVEVCSESFLSNRADEDKDEEKVDLVVFHDLSYSHKMDKFISLLQSSLTRNRVNIHHTPITERHVLPSPPSLPSLKSTSISTTTEGKDAYTPPTQLRRNTLPESISSLPTEKRQGVKILYIGPESLGLNNVLLVNGGIDVYSYDPSNTTEHQIRHESSRSNRLLMRRYAVMQKARDADVFGILVGTLGVANYLPLISSLRTLLSSHRRKHYTINVGKLNPAKLANFQEVECWVLVACGENSIVESKEFSKPIVTPYELAMALRSEDGDWEGKVVLDFERVIGDVVPNSLGRARKTREIGANEGKGKEKERAQDGDDVENEQDSEEEEDDKPRFSMITGQYRSRKLYGQERDSPSLPLPPRASEDPNGAGALVKKDAGQVVTHFSRPIGEFLQTRSYQGLEPRLGMDEPAQLEQGRKGIARGYEDDHPHPP